MLATYSKNSSNVLNKRQKAAELVGGLSVFGGDSIFDQIAELDYATYAERYLVIRNKQDTLVPFQLKRVQRHLIDNITGKDIIVKPRRVGISTTLQGYIQYQAFQKPSRWVTLTHDFRLGTEVFRTMQDTYYDNLPDALQMHRKVANAGITRFANGSEMSIATAGSKSGGRGATFGGGFHGSEVAYWPNSDSIMSGILQAVSDGGQVFLESTANGAQGRFYETVMGALNGDNDFTVHFYPWWWDEDYWDALDEGETLDYTEDELALVTTHTLQPEQIKWRRRKMREPGLLFEQEYPESITSAFVTSGNSVFYVPHEQLHIDAIPYDETMTCIAGIDWGQDHDSTALSIMDAETNREVALLRWSRQSWHSIRSEVIDILATYSVEKVIAERNAMGSSQIEALMHELEAVSLSATVQGYTMTNKKKDGLVKIFQAGLAQEHLSLIQDSVAHSELMAFEAKQLPSGLWTYSAPSGQHDDTVIARLLAWYGCQNLVRLDY